MELNLPRGMRDFPPEEKLARNEVVGTLTGLFEQYGFAPLETPVLERFDVLSAKHAGGSEILKETFKLVDQGKRELALRYDLTVPLARFIAMNPNVKLPFKRYQVEKVYRDGPVKLGRMREFYQCDCDIVGADSALADAQCLQLGLAAFAKLDIPVTIQVNSMALLKAALRKDGVREKQLGQAMLILDKLKKIGKENVAKELQGAKIDPKSCEQVIAIAAVKTSKQRLDAMAKRYGSESVARLREILSLVPDKRLVFNPSLSRGLAYYTGVVFEAYAEKLDSSLAAGGRYDRMIADFAGKEGFPAVGISFGLEPIMEVFEQKEGRKTPTQAFIIPIGTSEESMALAEELRGEGFKVDIDIMGRGVSKNLEYASALQIPAVIILGKKELAAKQYTLRDLRSGKEQQLARTELTAALGKLR